MDNISIYRKEFPLILSKDLIWQNGGEYKLTTELIEQQRMEAEINREIDAIETLLLDLKTKMLRTVSNQNQFLKQLKQRKNFLEWTIKKYNLRSAKMPNNVFKRDIFYCELGDNIGSEQSTKRPVVILQNDRGNYSSPLTIIAPITNHDKNVIKNDNGKFILKYIDEKGEEITKVLDYYEIPVKIEKGFSKEIKGFINLAQIRTISKKRLSQNFVAKITVDVETEIQKALRRLI